MLKEMDKKIIDLNELPLNTKGYIERVECEEDIKRRLLDLGPVKGAEIKPVLVSVSKDPRAFEIRGSLIAIRKENAKGICVSYYAKI